MKKQNLTTKLHKPVSLVVSIVVIVSVVLLGLIGLFIKYAIQNFPSNETTKVVLHFSPTPPPPTIEQAQPATFTSPDLGISFDYIPVIHYPLADKGQYFFTREIGNKVFLYSLIGDDKQFSGTDAEFLGKNGPATKSVEVFTKDPNLSLQDAIKQMFLNGYTGNDCLVKSTRYGFPREDMSYQTAIIDHRPVQGLVQVDGVVAKCPSPNYVTAFGVSYFIMDTKHPSKLLYISNGQDNIASGVKNYTWDETLKVLQ